MQDAVIARQDEEMSVMASRLTNLQAELGTSSTAVETLQLKSSGERFGRGEYRLRSHMCMSWDGRRVCAVTEACQPDLGR